MIISKTLQASALTLLLASTPVDAATHRTHRSDVKVVDVNAHAVPPLPSSRRVVVVNSAQHAKRHHGVVGMFQRLHKWHMRERAKLYRSMSR
jgi:predicted acylesterase/phospholipase RssA